MNNGTDMQKAPTAPTVEANQNITSSTQESTIGNASAQQFLSWAFNDDDTVTLGYADYQPGTDKHGEPMPKADNYKQHHVKASDLLREAQKLAKEGKDTWVSYTPRIEGSDSERRTKDTSAPGRQLYADVDHALTPQQQTLVDRLDASLIASGSGQNRHVHVRLSQRVRPLVIEYLNRALRDALQGDHKWTSDAVLRIPGTLNHKEAVLGGAINDVTVVKLSSTDHTVAEVAEILGVEDPTNKTDAELSQRTAKALGWDGDVRLPRKAAFGHLVGYLAEEAEPGARSEQTFRMVTNALEQGFLVEEIMYQASKHKPTLSRMEEHGRHFSEDVMRIVSKYPEHLAHTGRTCHAGGCPLIPEYQAKWDDESGESIPALDIDLSMLGDKPVPRGAGDYLPALPSEVYEYSDTMRQIRDLAYRSLTFPDGLLSEAMARVALMTDYRIKIDVGLGPLCLNGFFATAAVTGRNKNRGKTAAKTLISTKHTTKTQDYNALTGEWETKEVPIEPPSVSADGTKQGFLSTYIEQIPKPVEPGLVIEGFEEEKPKGSVEMIPMQTKMAALFETDEGEMFMKLGGQLTGTNAANNVLPLLRSLWSGTETQGTTNATKELQREIKPDTRAVVSVLVQPTKLGEIARDIDGGTPQRFLFLAGSGLIPSLEECDKIGDSVRQPLDTFIATYVDARMGTAAGEEPVIKGFKVPREIRNEVRASVHGNVIHERPDTEHEVDSQRPAMLAKITAWIVLMHATERIDSEGMLEVKVSDWELAKTIRDTSLKVLSTSEARIAAKEQREGTAKARAQGKLEAVKAEVVEDSAEFRLMERNAATAARKLWGEYGKSEAPKNRSVLTAAMRSSQVKQTLGDDGPDHVIEYGVEQGWIKLTEDGKYVPGDVEPPSPKKVRNK